MASPLSKRLQRIEQLLDARLNAPLATLWLNAGETHGECCIRCGYDPSYVDRIRFIRWLDPARGEVAPPVQHPLDPPIQLGPPDEASEKPTDSVTDISPQPVQPTEHDPMAGASTHHDPKQMDLEQMIAAKERYEAAIKRREAEIVAEKLAAASKAFAKSIV